MIIHFWNHFREFLLDVLSPFGPVENISLIPGKSFSFSSYTSASDAEECFLCSLCLCKLKIDLAIDDFIFNIVDIWLALFDILMILPVKSIQEDKICRVGTNATNGRKPEQIWERT